MSGEAKEPGKRPDRPAGGEGWAIHSGEEIWTAQNVILAVESRAAASILENSFGEDNYPGGHRLYFPRSLANAIVRLWFDRPPRPGPESGMFTGDFVMHNFFWLERMYAPYRQWHRSTGGSAIEVHIYGPEETLAQADALLLTKVITDFYRAYPELRGHLIYQHLQRNAATHTLPSLGSKERHLGISTPWPGLFCAGDWVRDTLPSFFLERACATGIKAANEVLCGRGLEPWPLVEYLPPEPFAGWIQGLMVRGRQKRRKKKSETRNK